MPETLSSLALKVCRKLADEDETVWSAQEIEQYLAEGYGDLVRRTRCLWDRENIAFPVPADHTAAFEFVHGAAGVRFDRTADWEEDWSDDEDLCPSVTTAAWESDYAEDYYPNATIRLPSDCLAVERVTWDDERIDPMTHADLASSATYRTTAGRPVGYLMDLEGTQSIRLYPRPDDKEGELSIEYYKRGVLSGSSSTFEIQDRYLKYLEHFAMAMAFARKGPGQDMKMAGHYMARYEAGVERVKARGRAAGRAMSYSLGSETELRRRPPRAQLPWNYGRVSMR
jgi:hypothetical protein